ncbi:MAG: thiol:disulfide interchange protein DsbC [Glaciecola sp.]|jgi:thiol:disulfide interchange protein DsbC
MMINKKLFLFAVLSCFSSILLAQGSDLRKVENNLRKANAQFEAATVNVVRELSAENFPGLYEARIDGQSLIVTKDGTRAIVGEVFDLQNMVNLTRKEMQKGQLGLVQQEIAKLSENDFVTYPASGETIGKLYVFSDTTCGYCKKLHKEVKDYQSAGIEVNYIPYPRSQLIDGEPAFENLKQIMCASDKLDAMDRIKAGTDEGDFVKTTYEASCVDSVRKGQLAGRTVGLEGTPFMYLSEGNVQIIPGYQPSERIIDMFQK